MQLSNNTINGSEYNQNTTEEKILSAFYKAFNTRNLQLMEDSWLNTDEVSMDNPIGGIRRGWEEIRSGYDKIFHGNTEVFVEFYDYSVHRTEKMFFATGRERGYFKSGELEIPLAIRTSRIFVLIDGNWKQIHHHGSIDNPELLKKYQEAILKNE
ncbi:MAG: nuclear transport factor 2 family protein [Chitinophagaceae bacterium]|nr:nuclear transport factor 2 family protein [Chitinophagaceae bacterium]